MAYKIIKNHTLEEYNKKYGENNKLNKVKKAEADKNPSLLDKKQWWVIDNVYYEIPNDKKCSFMIWWHNLGKGARTAICILGGVAAATAVVVPTVIAVKGCANTVSAELVDTQGAKIESSKFDGDYYVVMLKADDATKEVSEITSITIGNQTLIEGTDFTYDPITGKLSINKSVITANKNAKILIKAEVGLIQTRVRITAPKNVVEVGGKLQFTATVTPAASSSKTVKWEMVDSKNRGAGIDEDTGLFNGAVAGTYKIQAHLADDETIKSNIFEVTVKTDVTNIELSPIASGDVGGNVSLVVTVTPQDATVTYDWDIVDKTVVDWKTGEEHKSNTVILDALKAGTTNVSVTVKDQSGHEMNATCAVTIKDPSIISIGVTTEPKTEYYEGDKLNLDGMVVTATYSNGSTRVLESNEYTTNPSTTDELKQSDKKVTITLVENPNITTEFDITVKEYVAIQSVTIDNTQTEIKVDEEIELLCTINPTNATIKSLKWEVERPLSGEPWFSLRHDEATDKWYLKGVTADQNGKTVGVVVTDVKDEYKEAIKEIKVVSA